MCRGVRTPRVSCWLQVVGLLHRAFSAIHTAIAAQLRAHALGAWSLTHSLRNFRVHTLRRSPSRVALTLPQGLVADSELLGNDPTHVLTRQRLGVHSRACTHRLGLLAFERAPEFIEDVMMMMTNMLRSLDGIEGNFFEVVARVRFSLPSRHDNNCCRRQSRGRRSHHLHNIAMLQ
jgi:hypothetical protein